MKTFIAKNSSKSYFSTPTDVRIISSSDTKSQSSIMGGQFVPTSVGKSSSLVKSVGRASSLNKSINKICNNV